VNDTGKTTPEPQGFQVKARDHDGIVHDERWSASRETAEQVIDGLRSDPLVAAAWIEGDEPPLTAAERADWHGPECTDDEEKS